MNNSGRGNWFLMFVFLVIGMAVLVSAVNWNGAEGSVYNADEDTPYYHNLSANVTAMDSDISFAIDTQTDINWTYENGSSYLVGADEVSSWISITNTSTGNLTINATHNNQTGVYIIPIQVINATGNDVTADFTFNISSFNDAPNFTALNESYTFDESLTSHIFDINASDEEGEYTGAGYPLNWSVNVTNCSYLPSSPRFGNLNCGDLLLNNFSVGNTTFRLNITATNEFVGNYTVLLKVNDSNTETERNVTFIVANINDAPEITFACDNHRDMKEDYTNMSCWINATDVDEANNLTFNIVSNLGQFTFNDSSKSYTYNCSGSTGQCSASANVTFVLNDSAVGNWSVSIGVTDTGPLSTVTTGWENFSFFVDNVEDPVYIDDVADFTVFTNVNKTITIYDDDFWVSDTQRDVKWEKINITSSNETYVYFINNVPERTDSLLNQEEDGGTNYKTVIAHIDWDAMNSSGLFNTSDNITINISVVDTTGNSNWTEFTITFDQNNSAPVWDTGADYDFSINESSLLLVNLSDGYVSDADLDNITFYYTNSTRFDSFNLSNSTGSWVINFTAEDVDVGYHNITIYASDGNEGVNVTKYFNFTVNNVNDAPSIQSLKLNNIGFSNASTVNMSSGVAGLFDLVISDEDFLISSGQYNESLNVSVVVWNNSVEINFADDFNFSFATLGYEGSDYNVLYNASFTPSFLEVGNYTIVINVLDNSSSSDSWTFYLNITGSSNAPNLTFINNSYITIYDDINFTVSANDSEDTPRGFNLTYNISNWSIGAPDLDIGSLTGIVTNTTSLSDYNGTWTYNITVTDNDSKIDWQEVYVFIYGNATLVDISEGDVFNFIENVSKFLNLSINHSIGDNLTYEFWIDSISCSYQNNSDCSYGNLSLRNSTNSTGDGSVYGWTFTPNYTDETYDNFKNLTVRVYPSSPNLTLAQKNSVATNFSFKLNVTHTNQNVSFSGYITDKGPVTRGVGIPVDLSSYFTDVDYWDTYYSQIVNFTISTISGDGYVAIGSSFSDWILTLDSALATTELIEIVAYEYNSSNISIGNYSSNEFQVQFIDPVTTPSPSSGGGTRTKLKHFSLKLIAPQDVIISETGYIDIPFSVQNNGQTDLTGISLDSFVRFNDLFSDDVTISLGDNYIESLKFGESENFSMRIIANTQRAGKYKATIFANVTSPKFEDFADFFIEIKKANESEAEQLLIFTNEFIADNPECLELTELLKEAEEAFTLGEYSNSMRLAREVAEACEDSISVNDQVRYKVEGFVKDNIYNVSFFTLVIFFMGFVFYIYKRVRFNKSEMDEYV